MFTRDTLTCVGYEAIAPTSATGLTVPAGAVWASFTVEVNPVRVTFDGTTATTTVGQIFNKDLAAEWIPGSLEAVSFFEDGAGSLIKIHYFK